MAADSTNRSAGQDQMGEVRLGQEPKASPAARWFSVVVGILLVALGVVAARELILRLAHGVDWQSWLDPVLEAAALNELPEWLLWAAIVSAILGLILLYFAIRPRSKTHRRLESRTSLWARPVDIARLTTATAKRTPGVQRASSKVNNKSIRLDVQTTSLAPGVEDSIRQSITGALQPIVGDSLALKLHIDSPDFPARDQGANGQGQDAEHSEVKTR